MKKSAISRQVTIIRRHTGLPLVVLVPALLLILSLVLGGCDLSNVPSTPVGLAPAATATIGAPSTAVPTAAPAPTKGLAQATVPAQGESQAPTANPASNESTGQAQAGATPFVLLSGGNLADKWSDASYNGAVVDLNSTEVQRDGHAVSKITYSCGSKACAAGAADYEGGNTVDLAKYTHLHFWVNGGPTGGQLFGVQLGGAALSIEKYIPGGRIPANTWQEVVVPIADLAASYSIGSNQVHLVRFFTLKSEPPFYIDDIKFVNDEAPPGTPIVTQAQISVDIGSNRHPISPLIYGMANAPDEVMKDANLTLDRFGGNSATRYNWTLGDATSRGSDYEFANVSLSHDPAAKKPSGFADLQVNRDKTLGIATLLTIPLIGYVAKDDSLDTKSSGVPDQGGAPVSPGSEAIQGYDPQQNQQATSVKSVARKNAPFQDPPDPNAPAVYQDEWINHLTNTFGKSANGGVAFYSMDNEPDLWADNTHVDVHPVRVGYDDLVKSFLDYSTAVKAVDPTAKVTGPVISGWTGYWYSALDRGDDNFSTAADRKAHGGMPLIPWFLDQVHKNDLKTGQRTLDVLDIHYYPQAPALSVGQVGLWDSADAALRLRSTRALWDPSYKDESWISDSDSYKDPPDVQLIPLMKGWINQYYPGTKLGITEWRWYAEGTMNGALAIADVLGTYGREGVDLACFWDDIYNAPLKPGMPGLDAFQMYRNFDGHDGTFGDVSVAATTTTDPDKLSVFASEDTKTNQVKIIVLNKTRQEQMNTQIALKGGNLRGAAKVYQMSDNTDLKTNLSIEAMPDAALNGSNVSVSLPPYSITLLVIDKAQ